MYGRYQTQTPMGLIAHSFNLPSFGQREPWAVGSVGKEASGQICLWANRPVGKESRGQSGLWVNRLIDFQISGRWGLWGIGTMGKENL